MLKKLKNDKFNDEYTVSEFTELIKNIIKENINKSICIIGEISNFKLSKNNIFFTLKDEESIINVVIWNFTNRIDKTILDNGKKIKVYGSLVIFNKSGSYNLNVKKIELLGIGDLYQEYLKLKEFFEELGYFKEEIKKKLPLDIKKICIITALDGAALQDFLYVLNKNNYKGKVYIKNTIVQGKDCPNSIIEGLKILDDLNTDAIVLARGGGSFEDLFGFSNQQVIKAIYETKTCTISAIGHEIDFMLSDFVADIRAPTPSIAGEIISNINKEIYMHKEVTSIMNDIRNIIINKLIILESDLKTLNYKIKSSLEIIDKIIMNNDLLKKKIIK